MNLHSYGWHILDSFMYQDKVECLKEHKGNKKRLVTRSVEISIALCTVIHHGYIVISQEGSVRGTTPSESVTSRLSGALYLPPFLPS